MQDKDPRIILFSDGCTVSKMNTARMREYLRLNGYKLTEDVGEADVCIITTCITSEGTEDDGFRLARDLRAGNQHLRIVFAGCGPRALPGHYGDWDSFTGYEDVTEMFPHRGVPYAEVSFDGLPEARGKVSVVTKARECVEGGLSERNFFIGDVLGRLGGEVAERLEDYGHSECINFRKERSYWVIVSHGCNFRCSYCLVWKGLGPYRSSPKEEVFSQVRRGRSEGYSKFMIMSSDTASYGTDIYGRPAFGELLEDLFRLFPESKFGVRYLSPVTVQKVLGGADAERIFYLMVPIQSASARVLERMNRPKNLEDVGELLRKFRERYDGVLATQLIYGFPGETEGDIRETVRYLVDTGFDDFTFSEFSPRPGTPLADEKPCRDSESHRDILEEARRHLNLRYIHRVLSAFSGELAVRRKEVRLRRDDLPTGLARYLRGLGWGGWEDETDIVFSRSEFPGLSVRMKKGSRELEVIMNLGDGVKDIFSVELGDGEGPGVICSLEDLFGRGPRLVRRKRRKAEKDGLEFSIDKVEGLGDFLEITGSEGALDNFADLMGIGPGLPPYAAMKKSNR